MLLCRRLAVVMLLYTGCRFIFLFANPLVFSEAGTWQKTLAFLTGLRFDLSAVFSVNAPVILLSLIPFNVQNRVIWQKVIKATYLLCNIPFLWMNLADSVYFRFTGKRISAELLQMAGDVQDQTAQLFINFWPIILLWAVFTAILFYTYPKTKLPIPMPKPGIGALQLLIFSAITVAAIRGSFELKPLIPGNAFVLQPAVLGNLALNTPFVLFKTLGTTGVSRPDYLPNRASAQAVLCNANMPPVKVNAGSAGMPQRQSNVVIIILESFASEYVGYGNPYGGFTPFLDSLMGHSLVFPHNYSAGRRSVEAPPAILAGMPTLTDDSFITGPYSTNSVYGLGNALVENGRSTAFFHGGRNGTMGFDWFSVAAGFQKYYGMNEYPDKKDYDGNWGIADEPFLQWTAKKLAAMKQPYAACIFTLSSHQPYTIPEKYKGSFPKGRLPIHESIGYADNALRSFFKAMRRTPGFDSTLFILTGDHTQQHEYPLYSGEEPQYRVPLVFYRPGRHLPAADTGKVTQHLSVTPSVLQFLGIQPKAALCYGQSVFQPDSNARAITFGDGQYYCFGRKYYLKWPPGTEAHLVRIADRREIFNPTAYEQHLKEDYLLYLKASVQFYNTGLIDNNLFK
ncbi:MAG: sulfatase-like hydrolase/transferase [Bacteroidota bacterium]